MLKILSEENPDWFKPQGYLALWYIQFNKQDELKMLMKEILEKWSLNYDSDEISIWLFGVIKMQLGKTEEAKEIFKRVHEVNPKIKSV